ncbi:cleavage and polyadenylation specificity factor subunit 7-like [Brachionichthys hirsutus]|uniref:cleavage and polyadenylation specificity factor subunit 7-like n=1 Tax=Brachionichthys hirsutus TaxID=412623 RepID=UPI0036047ED4
MAAAGRAAGPGTSSKDSELNDTNQNDDDLDRIAEANELFDAVLTGSVNQDKKVSKNPEPPEEKAAKEKTKPVSLVKSYKEGSSLRRLSLYIGNFPWWTSDTDILAMAQTLGVEDITDIKFSENKANGQSRGYAEVLISSEESLKILLAQIPQCELHGEKIDCRFATRQNLALFEDEANKRIPQRAPSKDTKDYEVVERIPSLLSKERSTAPPPPYIRPLFPPHAIASRGPLLPNPFFSQPPPLFPHMPPSIHAPFPSPLFPPPPIYVPNPPPSTFHVNPAFAPAQDGRGGNDYSQPKDVSQTACRDYEELMNRNKVIASSAISKAVSAATAGDVRMSMETLLTAIAIVKQSRVYGDERCQTLVTSLKDCLVSIQGNYSSRSRSRSGDEDRDRDRGRERERDRDRERNRTRTRDYSPGWDGAGVSRRHGEHSWSSERDKERSRERERERHRDHRDRYR